MDQISMFFRQDAANSLLTSVAEQLPEAMDVKPLLPTDEQAIGLCDPSVFLTWNDLLGER